MPNGKCLPDAHDNAKQRENYIFLAAKIIKANIPCLEFLSNVTVQHILHCYQEEMKGKTDTASKAMLQGRVAPVVMLNSVLNCVDKYTCRTCKLQQLHNRLDCIYETMCWGR